MVISGFDWDDDNVEHIQRHDFTPEEVEEIFAVAHKIRRARQNRYVALGENARRALGVRRFPPLTERRYTSDHSEEYGENGAAAVPPEVALL